MDSALFDAVAHDYDKAFTNTVLGRLLRERVWQILVDSGICGFVDSAARFSNHQITKSPNPHALELNCGTGEDAIWLAKHGWQVLATDVSLEMVAVAKSKVERAGLTEKVRVHVCSFAEVEHLPENNFDLIFSNFGGLNCAPLKQLEVLGKVFFKKLKPGGKFVAVVMSRFCWWETLYFLLKMKPHEAFRRLSQKPVEARLNEKTTVPTWYCSPTEFRRLFCTPDFQVRRDTREHRQTWKSGVQQPVGFWLPPSYLNPFFEKRPRLLRVLNFLEKNCAPTWLAPAADHFLICLEKMFGE